MKSPFGVAATLSWKLETLNRIDQRGVSRFSGAPKGAINHLTPHLEGIIVPFPGIVKVAA
jgi:hypothetical protein